MISSPRTSSSESCTRIELKKLQLTVSAPPSLRPDSDELVIADFGIAKHIDPGQVLTSLAGSPGYAGESPALVKSRPR